jgi:GWxTD domain-containing protein
MLKRFYFVLALALLILPLPLSAQERYIEIVEKYARPKFFQEAVNLSSEEAGKSRLVINFKLAYEYLTFVRTDGNGFHATADFALELFRDKQSVGRRLVTRKVEVPDFESTKDKQKFIEGSVEIDAEPGKYEYLTEFSDAESAKQIRSERHKIELKNFTSQKLVLADPLMITSRVQTSGDEVSFSPVNINGNVYFGREFLVMQELVTTDTKPEKISWQLFKKSTEPKSETLIKADTLAAETLMPIEPIKMERSAESRCVFKAKQSNAGKGKVSMQRYMALLNLDGKKLDNARYVLKITVSDSGAKADVRKDFEAAWVDIPYSLYDLDLSIRELAYIASDSEISQIERGNSEERAKSFRAFWKKKDPTPDTEFNELMNEYYRRIDYAFFNLHSPKEYGWRTDRGKVYIIYGEPTRIERDFPTSGPTRETWYYDNLNKKFVFADKSRNGEFEQVGVYKTTPSGQ